MKQLYGSDPRSCKLCNHAMLSEEHLKKHIATEHMSLQVAQPTSSLQIIPFVDTNAKKSMVLKAKDGSPRPKIKEEVEQGKVSCPCCFFQSDSKTNILTHMGNGHYLEVLLKHHIRENNGCQWCSQTFSNIFGVIEHIVIEHRILDQVHGHLYK